MPMPRNAARRSCRRATPIRSPTTATQTIMTVVASTRGTTRKRIGWIACASSASISSETTIVPISAAMLAPAKPVSTIALTSGPSSRKIGDGDDVGDAVERAVVAQDRRHLQRQDRADAEQHQGDDRDALHADADHLRPEVLPPQPPPALGEQRPRIGGGVSSSR